MTASAVDRPLWRTGHFMLLWLAQAVSQTAQNAVHYGLIVLVQTRSHSTTHLSIAVLTVVVPSMMFGLVAGAYVDRRDKRWVLIATNALRAVTMLAYILFSDQLVLVYLANFLFATISQLFAPAEAAMIPALVERRRLIQANSLFTLTFTAAQLGGLVFFGPLVVSLIGVDGLFVLMAVSFAVCAALLWPLPSTRRRLDQNIGGFTDLWGDVREVLGVVRADRVMSWAVTHSTLGAVLAIVMATLAPAFVVEVLHVRAESSGFVMAPAGLGMMLGAMLLARWGQGFDKRRLIDGGVIGLGLALGALAFVGTLSAWLGDPPAGATPVSGDTAVIGSIGSSLVVIGGVMLTALLAGLAFVAVVVPSQTIIQERAPAEIRGRVFAVQLVLSNVATIVPVLLLGTLADAVGVDRTLLLVGLLVLSFGLVKSRFAPPREGEDPDLIAPRSAG